MGHWERNREGKGDIEGEIGKAKGPLRGKWVECCPWEGVGLKWSRISICETCDKIGILRDTYLKLKSSFLTKYLQMQISSLTFHYCQHVHDKYSYFFRDNSSFRNTDIFMRWQQNKQRDQKTLHPRPGSGAALCVQNRREFIFQQLWNGRRQEDWLSFQIFTT